MFDGIDLYSDTVTKPCTAMREAMINAEVGDDQKGEDPTTRKLEQTIAALLGKSAALFLPSATMANEIALMLHCQRGEELLAAENCHLFDWEAAGPAIHAGVMTTAIKSNKGIFSGDQVRQHFRFNRGGFHCVNPRLLCVENTANMGGGIAWTLEQLNDVSNTARELGLNLHLDGARLFNGLVRAGISAAKIGPLFDTITICFTKGLGAPVGACLVFDKELLPKVKRLRQLFGGALRQSGVLAASCLFALDNNIERLADDHYHAQLLLKGLQQIDGIEVEEADMMTNMVYFSVTVSDPELFLQNCLKNGLRFSHIGENRIRAVTHLDVNQADIEKALKIIRNTFS